MENLLRWAGRAAGLAGLLICAFAVTVRLGGQWSYHNFQVGSILQAGMAMLIVACLAYCASIAERKP